MFGGLVFRGLGVKGLGLRGDNRQPNSGSS